MGIGRSFTNKNNLLAILIFLVLIIFGLIVGLILTNNNNSSPNNTNELDTTLTPKEQAEAYINEAYDLSQSVLEGDTSHCDKIKADLETAKSLSSDEDLQIIAESILSACEPIKTGPAQIKTGGDNE
ncbi:hypothetical protein IKF21_02115 [Candidatus Saccharibacteria bacterium]|nr:hypothetical protein [Candidatus Saccharibacteria bacterium]